MFSTMTTESGRTVAVIDYSAVSTSGLGNLISGVAARLKDADIEEISFVETTLEELFSESYGRFIVACEDEKQIEKIKASGVECRLLGVSGGGHMLLHTPEGDIEITKEEMENFRSSTTRLMKF